METHSDLAELRRHDVLFIDIDGTITDYIGNRAGEDTEKLLGHEILWLMREAAVQQHGLDHEEAEHIIREVHDSIRWWHWTDFLRALDVDPAGFWQFAFERESAYLGPISNDLPDIVAALYRAGYKMFVTSNNVSSGILHKLRIAGLADIWGSRFFLRYLGPPDLHCMKDDVEFWHRALAHTGLAPARVTTIGDSWHDDVKMPRQAGITSSIHFDRTRCEPPEHEDGIWKAGTWRQIAELLIGEPIG